jgi:heat shock protein HslJ
MSYWLNRKWFVCTAMMIGFGITLAPPIAAYSLVQEPLILMAQASSIVGNWRLANISEEPFPTPMVIPQDLEMTVEFTADRLAGSGGCNRFMGGYETDGDQLNITPLASTRMACEETVMNHEFRFLQALEGAQRYEVNDQGLQIFFETEQSSGVLRFTSQTVRGLW